MKRITLLFSIALVVIAILISVPSFTQGPLWWDEAVYLGLAENVQNDGQYTLDVTTKVVDTFRPPLFPLLVVAVQQMFGQTEHVARFINPAVTILVALSLFFIGTTMYNHKVGFLAAIFTVTNSQYIFWNSKILSEPLAILVASWTLFAMYQIFGKNKREYYLVLFPLLALAFLTRYPLAALGIVVLAYALFMRRKQIVKEVTNHYAWLGLLLALVVLSPWFLYNHIIYGNIVGSVLTNFSVVQQYSDSAWIYVTRFFPNLQVLGVLVLAAFGYSFVTKDKRDMLSTMFILFCFGIFAFVLGQKDFRYTVVTLPAMALIAASFVDRIGTVLEMEKTLAVLITALVVSLSVPLGIHHATLSKETGESLQDAAYYIAANAPANSSVMTKHYPVFAYITKKHIVDVPKSRFDIDRSLMRYNVSYVAIDTIEDYPDWTVEHFRQHPDLTVEKVFSDERHTVTLYRRTGQDETL